MTAGRGIVHSEMPEQENGLLEGFQLWVNLPSRLKMMAPRYQDITGERIPELDGVPVDYDDLVDAPARETADGRAAGQPA